MKNHRVKAFTILEVTITMLVTVLLIGITYTSYSIMLKSYHSFTDKNEDMAILVNLDHLLKRDFGQADIILKTADGVALKKGDMLTNYIFNPDFVVRIAARTDTFKVQTQELTTTFESIPLTEIQDTEEQNRVDEMGFTLLFQNEKIPYLYHKPYSSENLIKRNPNAGN